MILMSRLEVFGRFNFFSFVGYHDYHLSVHFTRKIEQSIKLSRFYAGNKSTK